VRPRGPLFQKNRTVSARPGAFSKADRGSPEVEVGYFLSDVARLVKPHVIVEVGAFLGVVSGLFEEALSENAALGLPGRLITFELDVGRAASCSEKLGAGVTVVAKPVWEFALPGRVDLAFIDGPYEHRARSIDHLSGLMAPRGLMFLHDTAFTHEGQMGPLMQMVRGRFNVIEFPTARGLALIQPLSNLWDGSQRL
jgi:predicted O-methyltransferase YrrM